MRRIVAIAVLLAALVLANAARAQSAGDPTAGATIYKRCQGCHSIDQNRTGPMHRGLFGRPAGSVAGYNYSDAMKNSGIVWDDTTLDAFLAAPRDYVPGTKMTYAGIKDAQERTDLIAYLRAATAE